MQQTKGKRSHLRLVYEYQPKSYFTPEEDKKLRELIRPFIEAHKKRLEELRSSDYEDRPPAA